MSASAWHDIDVRGRHLASIIKRCNTKFSQLMEEGDYTMALAFLDRIVKAENAIHPYVDTYNGVQKYMKLKRKYEGTIPLSN